MVATPQTWTLQSKTSHGGGVRQENSGLERPKNPNPPPEALDAARASGGGGSGRDTRHIRAALAKAVIAAGIEVLAPARVASAAFEPREAVVTLADGRVLRAPVAVGAEGRGSVIRREAGIGALGWDYKQ